VLPRPANAKKITTIQLGHLLQQLVNLVFPAAEVSTFHKVVDLLPPPTSWGVQLEWPKEVGGVLEVGSNIHDLMDKILNTDDSKLAESTLNDVIGSDGSAVTSNLDVSTLVDQLANRLEVGRTPGNVGLLY